jgi:hypothetical protein
MKIGGDKGRVKAALKVGITRCGQVTEIDE